MNTTSCAFVGCQNLGVCSVSNGLCSCNVGYYGTYCENRWSDYNPPIWYFFRWFSMIINILMIGLSIALIIPFWVHSIKFPNINKPIAVQLTLSAASLFTVLTYAIDPFRFVASEFGYLTPSYRAGMSLISNLGLGLIACAYAFLGAAWISIRSKSGTTRGATWSTPATIMFWIVYLTSIILSGVCAGLWMVLSNNVPDFIYYAFICVFIVFYSFIIGWAAIATMMDLKRFAAKNTESQRSVARHVLGISVSFLCALIILIITIVAPINGSFASFIVVRCWIAMWVAVIVRIILAVHYRYKEEITFSLRSTNATSSGGEHGSSVKLDAVEI